MHQMTLKNAHLPVNALCTFLDIAMSDLIKTFVTLDQTIYNLTSKELQKINICVE